MRLKRLRLSGFKSFVEPAVLHIEPGLTGIVGPNGCGKSNLLEAIRWVMGENAPTAVRSAGMDDIIFAGTASRPPRDFAEVVLSGTDAVGDELEIVRRIDRGAGSAYRVNGADARAKDVALIFADAATGAHSPALVSQGKIAQVIAAKPAERRQMLEEAAGIAGLHVRRRDAESKLRSTDRNLERLEDLMAGMDSQIAALQRQARQAERYRELSDAIGQAEARLLYARWRDASDSAKEAQGKANEADDRVAQAKARAQDAQAMQHDAARSVTQARDMHADARDDWNAHRHRVSTLQTRLDNAEQRLADLDRQKARLVEDRGDADRLTRDAADALARLDAALADQASALQIEEEARPALAARLDGAEQAAGKAELKLAKATADHARMVAECRVADAEIAQARARLDRLIDERARIDRQRGELGEAAALQDAFDTARQVADGAARTVDGLQGELKDLAGRRDELRARHDAASDAHSAARTDLAVAEREHSALAADRAGRTNKTGVAIIDAIEAAPGYERAIAAVLGRDAASPTGPMKDSDTGRSWSGADIAPDRMVDDSLRAFVTRCPPELAARLALVHVADTDDGRALEPGEWLVTMSGRLRRWDGLIAHGENAAGAAQLAAQNRIRALEAKLPLLRDALDARSAALNKADADVAALQNNLHNSEAALLRAEDDRRAALRDVDQAEGAAERARARHAELDAADADMTDRRKEAERASAEAETRRSALPSPDASDDAFAAARQVHDGARTSVQAATAALAAADQSLAVARERLAAMRSDRAGWVGRSGDAARRLSDLARRLDTIEEERAVFAAKPAGLERELAQGAAIGEHLQQALADAGLREGEATSALGHADTALADAQERLADAREKRAGLAARAESEEARRAETARICGERFACPPPLLTERFGFADADIRHSGIEGEELDRLTASRERIGPVNLVAQDELAALQTSQGASTHERAELQEAVHRLRGSIGRLNREGRGRLRAAFDEVDTHFQQLFARLFDGGKAHLALIDSDDPLEAGLEIYAQPPGKRLQSLTLLSGGEQALTATALIFALFLTNPAPICVLDEVDAPLDDANINRFCNLLDTMAADTDTRYLIVTHNAVTMSRMHRLFGVTMIEPGISKLVSVDLNAAEELAAA